MKGKRLGRGLEEVSRVFLSSDPVQTLPSEGRPEEEVSAAEDRTPPAPIPTVGVTGGDSALTHFTLCNVALELARQGYRVLVIDDEGGRNVTRLMGLRDPEAHAEPVFTHAPMGVRIAYRTPVQSDLLSQGPPALNGRAPSWPEPYRRFDFILVHLPWGRFGEWGPLFSRISLCLVLVPAAPDGMLDAYRTIKALHRRARQIRSGVVVVAEHGEDEAAEAFRRMARNVKRFLGKELVSYAYVPASREVETSIEEGVPLVLKAPGSEERRRIYNIAGLLVQDHDPRRRRPGPGR